MTQRQRTGWFLVVALLVVFGMLRRGTRRVTALDHPSLDERDLAARDRAFRLAYPLLMVVVLVTFVVMVLDATEITRLLERGPAFESHETMSWVGTADIRSALLWVALWWVYLPTGILAWREPDAIGLGRGASPGVPEQTRDAYSGWPWGRGWSWACSPPPPLGACLRSPQLWRCSAAWPGARPGSRRWLRRRCGRPASC